MGRVLPASAAQVHHACHPVSRGPAHWKCDVRPRYAPTTSLLVGPALGDVLRLCVCVCVSVRGGVGVWRDFRCSVQPGVEKLHPALPYRWACTLLPGLAVTSPHPPHTGASANDEDKWGSGVSGRWPEHEDAFLLRAEPAADLTPEDWALPGPAGDERSSAAVTVVDQCAEVAGAGASVPEAVPGLLGVAAVGMTLSAIVTAVSDADDDDVVDESVDEPVNEEDETVDEVGVEDEDLWGMEDKEDVLMALPPQAYFEAASGEG